MAADQASDQRTIIFSKDSSPNSLLSSLTPEKKRRSTLADGLLRSGSKLMRQLTQSKGIDAVAENEEDKE